MPEEGMLFETNFMMVIEAITWKCMKLKRQLTMCITIAKSIMILKWHSLKMSRDNGLM